MFLIKDPFNLILIVLGLWNQFSLDKVHDAAMFHHRRSQSIFKYTCTHICPRAVYVSETWAKFERDSQCEFHIDNDLQNLQLESTRMGIS